MIIKGNTVGHPIPDPRNGGVMQGGINMNGHPLTGLKEPEADTDAATKSYVQRYADTKQPQHINKVITLSASGWSDNRQTVSWAGLEEDDTLISTPSADSRELYTECGVKLYSQAQGSLTFVCEDVPSEELTIDVSRFPLGGSGTAGGGGSSGGGVDYVIPEFDLAAMGLPAISMEGDYVNVLVDTTDLFEALNNGLVKVRFAVDNGDGSVEYFSDVVTGMNVAGYWIVSRTLTPLDVSYSYTIWVSDHVIYARILELQTGGTGGGGDSYEIPEFDLAAMGLPAIPTDGSYVSVNADTTSLIEAFDKGMVKLRCATDVEDTGIEYFTEVATGSYMGGHWLISRSVIFEDVYYSYAIWVGDNVIWANALKLQTALPQWNGGSY